MAAPDTEATAIRAALDRLRLEMLAAGLLEDAPALAPQAAGPPALPSPMDLRRELNELHAQMEAAGVFSEASLLERYVSRARGHR